MLAACSAVAFVPVADLDRARAFYEGVLGLKVLSQDVFAVLAQAGGVKVRLTRAPPFIPHPFTILGFDVEDVEAEVEALGARGATFERYAFLGAAQNARGVWTIPGAKVAWFKDPDGNLLSVQQMS